MTKSSTPSSCPFCDRDAGAFSNTRRRKPTFYCAVCHTRVFFNSQKALAAFASWCTGPDGRPLYVDSGDDEE